jgi:hypothetical protein
MPPRKKVAKSTAVLECCGNCRFYKPNGDAGICQRYPAKVIVDGGIYSVRPVMEPAEWCGEHQGPRQ